MTVDRLPDKSNTRFTARWAGPILAKPLRSRTSGWRLAHQICFAFSSGFDPDFQGLPDDEGDGEAGGLALAAAAAKTVPEVGLVREPPSEMEQALRTLISGL